MDFTSYLKLIRPVNCIMAAIATVIGFFVSNNSTSFNIHTLLLMISAFLICGAGQAINDYFDIEVDKKKKLNKPLVSGKISPKNALAFSISLFLVGVILAFVVNLTAFAIALIFSLLLFVYSWKMKNTKFFGNILVSIGTAAPLIFGSTINQNYEITSIFALSAFFANMGREITKDIEDKKADLGEKKTLAQTIPLPTLKMIVFAMYAAAITSAAIVLLKKPNQTYPILLTISAILFLATWFTLYKNNPNKSQKLSKIAMIVSLLAFLSWVI